MVEVSNAFCGGVNIHGPHIGWPEANPEQARSLALFLDRFKLAHTYRVALYARHTTATEELEPAFLTAIAEFFGTNRSASEKSEIGEERQDWGRDGHWFPYTIGHRIMYTLWHDTNMPRHTINMGDDKKICLTETSWLLNTNGYARQSEKDVMQKLFEQALHPDIYDTKSFGIFFEMAHGTPYPSAAQMKEALGSHLEQMMTQAKAMAMPVDALYLHDITVSMGSGFQSLGANVDTYKDGRFGKITRA